MPLMVFKISFFFHFVSGRLPLALLAFKVLFVSAF